MTTASPSGDRLRLLLERLMLLQGGFSTLYLLLRLLIGEAFWPVALINAFSFWVLLLSLLILPLALVLRAWPSLLINLPGLVALLVLFGWTVLPPVAGAAAEAQGLRVMTFNVAADGARPEAIVAAIRAAGADIVTLNELGAASAALIESELADSYPYRALYPEHYKGLLSRYPILEESEPFSVYTTQQQMLATVAIEGQPVRLLMVHLQTPGFGLAGYRVPPEAEAELDFLLAEATGASEPCLLLGDFNLPDQSDGYRRIVDAGLRDAYFEAGIGPGFSYPSRNIFLRFDFVPLLRLDYIFYSADFEAISARLGPHASSDHLPLIADLLLQSP